MPNAKDSQFEETTIDKLVPDSGNLNLGSERGNYMIERSIRELGWGRPIIVDKNNQIIGGNHAVEVAGQLGYEKVKIIETSGDEIVVHRRLDLDLSQDDPKARLLSIADNRASQVSLHWDASGLAEIAAMTTQLDWFFHKNELDLLQGLVEPPTESSKLPTNPQMATSPAWAHGSDDDEDDDEDPDVRWPGEMPSSKVPDDPDEEEDVNEAAKASRALPIVLNAAEYRSWRKAKDQLGVERDKVALLKLVQRYLEEIEPAKSSELA